MSIAGSLTPQQIRQQFGLKYDAATAAQMDNKSLGMNKKGTKTRLQTDDGHFWYKDSNGQQKYLGQATNYDRGSVGYGGTDRKGSDISDYHAGDDKMKNGQHLSSNKMLQQAHDINNGPGHNNGFNSVNDLGGAFRTLLNTEAPQAAPEPKPIQLSDRAAEAKAYTGAYEDVMLPRQGDYVINNDQSVVNDFDAEYKLQLNKAKQPYMADGSDVAQDFKNKYEANLTNELREKVPGALEEKAEDIKQKDVYSFNHSNGLDLV